VKRFITTWKTVMFHPKEFFQNMPTEGGYLGPLKFALICHLPLILRFSSIYTPFKLLRTGDFNGFPVGFIPAFILLKSTLITVVIIVGMVVAELFIGSALLHLGTLVFVSKGDYQTTFRIFSYASAVNLLVIIPAFGFVYFYESYLLVVGIKEIHRTTWIRSILALSWLLAILVYANLQIFVRA